MEITRTKGLLSLFLLVTLSITACGGGGSSSDTASSASQASQALQDSHGDGIPKSDDDVSSKLAGPVENIDDGFGQDVDQESIDHGLPEGSGSFPQDSNNTGDTAERSDSGHNDDVANAEPCSLCDPSVILSWEPNPEKEVIGYEVWYSLTSNPKHLEFYQDLHNGHPGFDPSSPRVKYSALKHLSVYQGNVCFAVKAYSTTQKSELSEMVCGHLG